MEWWNEMIGDLVLEENLQAAFALAVAIPLSIALAAIGQLLKRLPVFLLSRDKIPDYMAALGLVVGFVASYAFDLPKVVTTMAGTMAGTLSGRAYDATRPALKKLGPSGGPAAEE